GCRRGEAVRPLAPPRYTPGGAAESRGRVVPPWRCHGADRGERARGGIEHLPGGDPEPAIAIPARDQDRAVIEQGRGVAPDGRRQTRRKLGGKPGRRVVELGRCERLAGGVLTARDEHRAVYKQRGGVPRRGLGQV